MHRDFEQVLRFYSKQAKDVSLKTALFQGFAPGGDLYLPQQLPFFDPKRFRGLSFLEVSFEIAKVLFPEVEDLETHLEAAFDFPLPFVRFPDKTHILELFHGPTFSFKDIGARFFAHLIRIFMTEETTVLVATSGDTGSAVGHAFLRMPGVRVYILYPKGGVTFSQEKQLTTLGHNVQAIEIDGNFEACQELVKCACLDPDLPTITVGNSINVGRLLAHTFYYFYAYSQLDEDRPAFFSIPCGNFGHLVAGILAKRMGLPIARFIGATNVNDEVPLFLRSGVFQPHPAYHTMSVSMDVGNPSNFPRLLELYGESLEKIRADLIGVSFTDDEVKAAIKKAYMQMGYLLDPHSAISYLGLKQYLEIEKGTYPGIFFATAHPAKFQESLEPLIGRAIPLPDALKRTLTLPKSALSCSVDYTDFKELISSKG